MSTAVEERLTPIVEYGITDAAIDVLRDEYSGLKIETTADYEKVRLAIADVRDRRVTVEKTRVELKAGALEYGRKVDSEAKRITALLTEIEEPLKAEKQRVDDEKARVKREKEEAERAKIEAELKAKREAEEAEAARLKAEQDERDRVERERIAAEQKVEAERLAKERAAFEAEQAKVEEERRKQQAIIDEQNRIMQAKLDEEAAALKAEKERLQREQFEREAKERAEREAREKLEREAAEKKAREEAEAEERERLAALAPDREKLTAFAETIATIAPPVVKSSEAMHYLERACDHLQQAAVILRSFAENNPEPAELKAAS